MDTGCAKDLEEGFELRWNCDNIYTGITSVKERPCETGNPEEDDDSPNGIQAKVFLILGNEGKIA
jgi:hypothetical protein